MQKRREKSSSLHNSSNKGGPTAYSLYKVSFKWSVNLKLFQTGIPSNFLFSSPKNKPHPSINPSMSTTNTEGSIDGPRKHRPPSLRITEKWPRHHREADREQPIYTEERHFNTWSTFWAIVAARYYPTTWAEPEGEFERVDQGREIWRCVRDLFTSSSLFELIKSCC